MSATEKPTIDKPADVKLVASRLVTSRPAIGRPQLQPLYYNFYEQKSKKLAVILQFVGSTSACNTSAGSIFDGDIYVTSYSISVSKLVTLYYNFRKQKSKNS